MEYLVLKNITKRYKDTGILANDRISLSISQGEIHAIVGDNGAGKSTLGKILYGLIKRDDGEIFLKGKRIKLSSEKEARRLGIYLVPQEDFFIGTFKVWENIVLGGESLTFGFLNKGVLRRKVRTLMDEFSLYLPLNVTSSSLSMGQKRLLSILKALYKKPELLILDEPTSFLLGPQVEEFLDIILSLRKKGLTIIFISHRWKEVDRIADRITLLDKGKVVGTYEKKEFFRVMKERLYRFDAPYFSKRYIPSQEVLFGVSHIHLERSGMMPLYDISFQLKEGEILSILSIAGNGERELEKVVSGYIAPDKGEFFLKKEVFRRLTPSLLRKYKVGLIPSNIEDGICDFGTLWENIIVSKYRDPQFLKGCLLNFDRINAYTREQLKAFDLPYEPDVRARSLSGGRKRRLLLSRELQGEGDFIIAGNPTSSLDSLFTKRILKSFKEIALRGKGVLFFSYNIDDALFVSDRIMVLYRGKIVKNFDAQGLKRERLIAALMGKTDV